MTHLLPMPCGTELLYLQPSSEAGGLRVRRDPILALLIDEVGGPFRIVTPPQWNNCHDPMEGCEPHQWQPFTAWRNAPAIKWSNGTVTEPIGETFASEDEWLRNRRYLPEHADMMEPRPRRIWEPDEYGFHSEPAQPHHKVVKIDGTAINAPKFVGHDQQCKWGIPLRVARYQSGYDYKKEKEATNAKD